MDGEQQSALELFRSGRSFLLVGHERPDGDCLGAQAALARILSRMGKEVVILNADDPGERFDYLYPTAPFSVHVGGPPPEHEVCVLLDFNDLSRCGRLAGALAEAGSKKLVVDHHPPSVAPFWDERFVDVSAAATGVLAWRIGRALGVEPDVAAARAVFTSLVTDTGWFRYSNTDSEALALAAELVALGVEPAEMYRRLFQRNDPDQPIALAGLLSRLRYFADGRVAVVDEPGGDGKPMRDSDAALDILRSVREVEVVVYLRELERGRCKLSARSKTDYDVNVLARRFGGGGHRKASGAVIEGSLEEVRERIVGSILEDLAGARVVPT